VNELDEREFLLLERIARSPDLSQRELSEHTGLSLGMTNLLLKRLVQKGYVKVLQLNWKKVRYILTVRGAMEKARKSYAYAARNYHEFKRMSARIRANLLEEYGRGLREFVIASPPEIEELIREVIRGLDLPGATYALERDVEKALARSKTVFCAAPESGGLPDGGRRVIPILEGPEGILAGSREGT